MGVCLHWIAMKKAKLPTVCSVLGLRPTGAREEFPESKFVGLELPSGYVLIVYMASGGERLRGKGTIEDRHLAELSRSHEVISSFVEEHVMFSETSCWKSGGILWSVTHESEKGLRHLGTSGPVPAELEPIRQGAEEKQEAEGENAEVDFIFDIPVDLAQKITGYRYDQDVPGMSGKVFEVLEQNGSASRPGLVGALKNLFGKTNRK